MSENVNAPLLTREDINCSLTTLNVDPNDTRFSVLLAPDHKCLPAVYFQISGADPLRDEGLLYEKILKAAGVPTKLDQYPGFPHAGHYALSSVALAKKLYKDFELGVDWLLKTPKKTSSSVLLSSDRADGRAIKDSSFEGN